MAKRALRIPAALRLPPVRAGRAVRGRPNRRGGYAPAVWFVTVPNIKNSLALCALLRTIDTFRLFEKVNVLTGGGPANTTSTITQYLYNYGIKSLDFGFGSAGAIVMTLLVLVLSSFYIKRAIQ